MIVEATARDTGAWALSVRGEQVERWVGIEQWDREKERAERANVAIIMGLRRMEFATVAPSRCSSSNCSRFFSSLWLIPQGKEEKMCYSWMEELLAPLWLSAVLDFMFPECWPNTEPLGFGAKLKDNT